LLLIGAGFDAVWSQLNLGSPGMTLDNFFGILVEAQGGGVGRAKRGLESPESRVISDIAGIGRAKK